MLRHKRLRRRVLHVSEVRVAPIREDKRCDFLCAIYSLHDFIACYRFASCRGSDRGLTEN